MGTVPEDHADIEGEAERIAKELDIPPCPAILTRFDQEFQALQPDLRKLAALVSSDIGLSAIVLKTVNSPFYGLARKVTSVEQALAVLGLRSCANLVSGLLLRRAFPAGSNSTLERFWDRTTRIAGLAAATAARLKGVNRQEAHTFVLFRDCGMLVMLRRFPEYVGIMEAAAQTPGAQLVRGEDTRFRFNHARVACALARSWSLAEPLCRAILYHHAFDARATTPISALDAESADQELIAFGHLAEQVAALRAREGLCPDWIGVEEFVLATLGITAEQIVELAEEPLAGEDPPLAGEDPSCGPG